MEIDFQKLMLSKSDEGLQEYIDNRLKYTPEAVESAITEMKKRGRIFTNEELVVIRNDIKQKQQQEALIEKKESSFGRNNWTKNVVEDENAPAYYSERAIYGFSVAFGVISGAILLAINCAKSEAKKDLWQIVAFGVTFTGAQMWILSMIPRNTGLTIGCSIGGAYILNGVFWKKYIGKDTKYRTRPIWIPLIIAIAITAPILWAMIYFNAY